MTSETYLDLLGNRLERHFAIERNAVPLADTVDILARCRQDLGRTFISQKDIIDKFWEEEIIIVRCLGRVEKDDVSRAASMIEEAAEKLVAADMEHRLSVITAVLVAREGVDPSAARAASRFRWNRSYKLYFHGFAEGRMVLVDCAAETLALSPRSKRSSRAFEPRPAEISKEVL